MKLFRYKGGGEEASISITHSRNDALDDEFHVFVHSPQTFQRHTFDDSHEACLTFSSELDALLSAGFRPIPEEE